MALLSKDQILSADDMSTTDVEVKEWGGVVRLSTMQACQRDAYEQTLVNDEGKTRRINNLRALYLSYCIVDEDGELMFSEKEVFELGKKSAAAMMQLFEKATDLNRSSADSLEITAKN